MRMSLQISLQAGQSFAHAGMKAPLAYVSNFCRPEMTHIRVMNVLENFGPLVGAQENSVSFNCVCFTLKSVRWRQRALSERSVSASVDVERTSIELKSCLLAKEVYLMDKRASIEIEAFVSLQRHCTFVIEIRAFLQSEK